MATNRLEILKSLVEQKPTDSFARYGLAMEYVKSGDLEDAVSHFQAVIANDPAYAYAYFHGGQALEKLGRIEDAKQMYEQGVTAATRKGDQHAVAELSAALELLPI